MASYFGPRLLRASRKGRKQNETPPSAHHDNFVRSDLLASQGKLVSEIGANPDRSLDGRSCRCKGCPETGRRRLQRPMPQSYLSTRQGLLSITREVFMAWRKTTAAVTLAMVPTFAAIGG